MPHTHALQISVCMVAVQWREGEEGMREDGRVRRGKGGTQEVSKGLVSHSGRVVG